MFPGSLGEKCEFGGEDGRPPLLAGCPNRERHSASGCDRVVLEPGGRGTLFGPGAQPVLHQSKAVSGSSLSRSSGARHLVLPPPGFVAAKGAQARHSTAQPWRGTSQHCTAMLDEMRQIANNSAKHDTAQHGTARHITAHHITSWDILVQHLQGWKATRRHHTQDSANDTQGGAVQRR